MRAEGFFAGEDAVRDGGGARGGRTRAGATADSTASSEVYSRYGWRAARGERAKERRRGAEAREVSVRMGVFKAAVRVEKAWDAEAEDERPRMEGRLRVETV